jgi:hypothetical protein
MKRIKTFRLFESGISNRLVQDLSKEIKSLMEERYSPNTRREAEYDPNREEIQEFKSGRIITSVLGNESKYGKTIEVAFLYEPGMEWEELNEEIRQATLALDIIDAIEAIEGKTALLIGFNVFGDKQMGHKNGHTMEIEDMMDKFADKVHSMDLSERSDDYTFMNLWFLIK